MSSLKANMIVRSMSTSSASTRMIKPPIQIFSLEGRYAAALYSASTKNKQLDSVEKDLVQFQKSIKSDPQLKEFIINPTLKRSLKADALKHVATKINMSSATSNLLVILAENGRLGKLEGVINAFKIMMAAHRGEVTCEVTTAKPLDQTQKQNLEAALKKFLKSNETLHLTAVVDPSIMGGMVVSIGDKYVDMSVSSKVKKYTELISTPI